MSLQILKVYNTTMEALEAFQAFGRYNKGWLIEWEVGTGMGYFVGHPATISPCEYDSVMFTTVRAMSDPNSKLNILDCYFDIIDIDKNCVLSSSQYTFIYNHHVATLTGAREELE